MILGRLNRAGVRNFAFSSVVTVGTVVAVVWTASISGLFSRPREPQSVWNDVWHFILWRQGGQPHTSVPYLSDYPSMIFTITITASICLVYNLYRGAAVLHSDMEAAGCVKYNDAGRAALTGAVNDVNEKFRRWGRYSPLALALSLAFVLVINLRLRQNLFPFLEPGGLYPRWWASLRPLRPGGVVWVIFGGISLYVVYIEAVLGLIYVQFLRKCRGDFQFRANMLNPDGLFGWARLRQLISNMEAGVVCALVNAWAMSYFVQPALGSIVTAIVVVAFAGVVLYVFIEVSLHFRRQVREDKDGQRAQIGREIEICGARGDVESLLQILVAYKRLELVSKIPLTPIRARLLWAGALSVIGPISAIAVQVIKYLVAN